jgi:hypothetical protein
MASGVFFCSPPKNHRRYFKLSQFHLYILSPSRRGCQLFCQFKPKPPNFIFNPYLTTPIHIRQTHKSKIKQVRKAIPIYLAPGSTPGVAVKKIPKKSPKANQ